MYECSISCIYLIFIFTFFLGFSRLFSIQTPPKRIITLDIWPEQFHLSSERHKSIFINFFLFFIFLLSFSFFFRVFCCFVCCRTLMRFIITDCYNNLAHSKRNETHSGTSNLIFNFPNECAQIRLITAWKSMWIILPERAHHVCARVSSFGGLS